jgi:hypothetical protein
MRVASGMELFALFEEGDETHQKPYTDCEKDKYLHGASRLPEEQNKGYAGSHPGNSSLSCLPVSMRNCSGLFQKKLSAHSLWSGTLTLTIIHKITTLRGNVKH